MKQLASLTQCEMTSAWERRDPTYDGLFVFGVKTTGIFCRPSCSSRPQFAHLEFFRTTGEAVTAGYRPCRRCQPQLANGQLPPWVSRLMSRASDSIAPRVSARDLRALGIQPEQARRWFQKNLGMSFAAWCRGQRLARAFERIRSGDAIDEVALEHGFESHSGFRSAFARIFGKAPGKSRKGDCLRLGLIASPLGPMLAASSNDGLRDLGFADARGLDATFEEMRRLYDLPVVLAENQVLKELRHQLQEYFAGRRRDFSVPLAPVGTPFQQEVWAELQRIPYGGTASYEAVAQKVGSPTGMRAVARANGTNRVCILIPCHRVIAKDGSLSGYGAGVWRKRLLLELETKGASRSNPI